MRLHITAFALLITTGLNAAASAQHPPKELPRTAPENVEMSGQKLRLIDQAIEKRISDKKVAGVVVMILRRGNVVYHKAYGMADIEHDKSMEEDTIFRIYSMTKVITTAAAMMLWEEGAFKLDDPVSKFLPGFQDLKVHPDAPLQRPITVRDLMRHTSGLTYGWGADAVSKAYQQADLFNRETTLTHMTEKLERLPLLHQPATEWHYGVSIDVLGHLVEHWSGMGLDAFFTQRIFKPLEMIDTGFFVPAEKSSRLAANYTHKLQVKDDPTTSRYLKKTSMLSGGGGLVSTSRDYMHFLAMLQNNGTLFGQRLLKPETIKLMQQNHLPKELMPIRFGEQKRWGVGHGLGFNVRTAANNKWDPPGRIGEYGWGGMASTHYWASPSDQLAVVTLEQFVPYNFDTEWAIKNLIYDAIEE